MPGLSVPGRFAPMRNHVRLCPLADIVATLPTRLLANEWGIATSDITLDQTEEIFAYEVSDKALETAAGTLRQVRGNEIAGRFK